MPHNCRIVAACHACCALGGGRVGVVAWNGRLLINKNKLWAGLWHNNYSATMWLCAPYICICMYAYIGWPFSQNSTVFLCLRVCAFCLRMCSRWACKYLAAIRSCSPAPSLAAQIPPFNLKSKKKFISDPTKIRTRTERQEPANDHL